MTARAVLFDRETRDANAHVRAGREQSEADHQAQLRDLRAWPEVFAHVEPCPACSWSLASFHCCPANAS